MWRVAKLFPLLAIAWGGLVFGQASTGGNAYVPGITANSSAGGDASGPFSNLSVNSTGGVPFAPSATIDATNPANLVGGSGRTVPANALQGLTWRSVTSGTVTITSSDNSPGGIHVTELSAWAATLPQIGTSGIAANAFSTILCNEGAGVGTITPSTSTINSTTSINLASGQCVHISADESGSNYIGILEGVLLPMSASNLTGGTMAGTTALINVAVMQATGFSPTSATCSGTSDRFNLPATHELGFCVNGNEVGFVDASGNVINSVAAPTITAITGTCTYGTAVGNGKTSGVTVASGSGTCSFRATYSVSQTNGYQCGGSDETQSTQAITVAHTTNSCTMRITSAVASDNVSWTANPY